MSPETSPPAIDLKQLAADVADLRVLIRVMLGVVFAAISYLSFMALWKVPHFEKIFEDMLGDRSKLPEISRWVIEWSRLGGGLVPLGIIAGLIVAGFAILATVRSVRLVGLGFVACAIPLLLHFMICLAGTWAPLITIVKGLSG